MFRHFFFRWGIYAPALTDEAIYPNYYRGKHKILAGWDNWQGYYWLADNEQTSIFLKDFYYRHLNSS